MSLSKLSKDNLSEFKIVRQVLEDVINKHLPGDFSNWEEDHTTWNGPTKIVDMTEPDPRTTTCALNIFHAFIYGEEALGFANKKSDLEALSELQQALHLAKKSLEKLSTDASIQLHNNSRDSFSSSFGAPPIFLVDPLTDSLLKAISATRMHVENEGSDNSKQNRVAASVTKACQKVYETRSEKKAPKTVNEHTYPDKKAVPFVEFTDSIFKELGIDGRVGSSLSVLKGLSN